MVVADFLFCGQRKFRPDGSSSQVGRLGYLVAGCGFGSAPGGLEQRALWTGWHSCPQLSHYVSSIYAVARWDQGVYSNHLD